MSNWLDDLLLDLATRCNVKSEKVLRKSKELIALLNSKQQLSCSDTCKVVICLELASSFSSSPFSRVEAIKYSGYKKRNYTNLYNNISKLLNLDRIYSVAEICLLIGVSHIKEPVIKLLQKYQSSSQENYFEHPMYACAAVMAFCRANKIKINQMKLVEISRIKRMELEELCKKFSILLNIKKKNESIEEKKITASTQTKVVESKGNEKTPRKKQNTSSVMSNKEYEEWKKKMLEE